MDTVIHLERIKRSDTDVSFQLEFRKARERMPDNRADFETITVALAGDAWQHGTGEAADRTKLKRKPSERQTSPSRPDRSASIVGQAATTAVQPAAIRSGCRESR